MPDPDDSSVLIERITPTNLLSFGPETEPIELGPLNILIGPNGSGKSNLIETIALMRATPFSADTKRDVRSVVREGGGTAEWIWKGAPQAQASFDAVIDNRLEDQTHRYSCTKACGTSLPSRVSSRSRPFT